MSKFVIFAVLLTFIVCLAVVAESKPQGLNANQIIQKIIGKSCYLNTIVLFFQQKKKYQFM